MKKLLIVAMLTSLTAALTGCSGGAGGRMFSGCRLFGGGNRGQQCNSCYQQPTCCPTPCYGQTIPAYGNCCPGACSSCPSCCGGGFGQVYPGAEMPGMMAPGMVMPGGGMPGTIIQGPTYEGDQIPVLPGPTPTPSTVPGPATDLSQ